MAGKIPLESSDSGSSVARALQDSTTRTVAQAAETASTGPHG